MIPTAEVPVTNIYRDMILKETDLRLKWRLILIASGEKRAVLEPGRGLNRVHEFEKVEIIRLYTLIKVSRRSMKWFCM
jgi:seryl-tRNA synthetase